jgi:ADP-ribose pyrophosphatase YjhB (NUDIX family)
MLTAGCLFTDGLYVLCGLQKEDDKMVLSGFGGKAEGGESSVQCAIRETFEELFNITEIPKGLLNDIFTGYIPNRILQNGSYSVLVYSFWELEDFLTIARYHGIQSPVYSKLPRTIQDLLFSRKVCEDAEIKGLALLPLSEISYSISGVFMSDLKVLLEKKNSCAK